VEQGERLALVQVGNHTIDRSELSRFQERLPEHLHSKEAGITAVRDYLQSLVDRHLLLVEAKGAGLADDSPLQQKLDQVAAQRLIETVFRTLINPKVQFSEEDLQAAYERFDLGWQVLPAHLLSATEEDAREVIRLLQAGADFFELAKERSLANDAERGGDLGKFFSQGDAIPALREATFHLAKGAHSEPIKTKDGYEIVKVLDRRRLPYTSLRQSIAKQMAERKAVEERDQVLAELKERHQLRYHGEQMHWLVSGVRSGQLDAADRTKVLFSFKDGLLTIGQCYDFVLENSSRKLQLAMDSLKVLAPLEKKLVADILWVRFAKENGIDKDPAFQVWKEERLNELLVKRLFEERVSIRVKVTADEVKTHYEENIDAYRMLPGGIELTEVLVDSEVEAVKILEAVRAGESLKTLAQRHSVRSSMGSLKGHTFGESGYVRIDFLIVTPYREALGDTNSTDVGVLKGPLPMQDKYSVYRLERPIEWATVPFKQYRRPIGFRLRKKREEEAFSVPIGTVMQISLRWQPGAGQSAA